MEKSFSISVATNYEGVLYDDAPLQQAVKSVLQDENCPEAEVDLILVDDEFLRELKFEYFNQDVYTDVISFRLNPESEARAEGEIYISLDRAAEQALEYDVTADIEILRLAIHGTLHLLGYEDDTDEKKAHMSAIENRHLEQFSEPTVIQSIPEE
ncbi:MAG: rRNA maturation RNase YbeY [Candidatus Marinimicrobia bacterium]|nr:rRNA maturation RNase YbeY [Candidatus Neomarinimicrobiota bacterium]